MSNLEAIQTSLRQASAAETSDALVPQHAALEAVFLPGLPWRRIVAAFEAAAGNEIKAGKLFSQESSAALAANAFGFFLHQPAELPALPGLELELWPACGVHLEATVRFPWSGGRHPCLDILVETEVALIGIESKRYEPFRCKSEPSLSDAYWRPVWGPDMSGYEAVRDGLKSGSIHFERLDAVQLVKHAFALRTEVHRQRYRGRRPVLFYLHAEPECWSTGLPLDRAEIESHRAEIERFAQLVADNEVTFQACTYAQLLASWDRSPTPELRAHASALAARFRPL